MELEESRVVEIDEPEIEEESDDAEEWADEEDADEADDAEAEVDVGAESTAEAVDEL